MLNRGTYVYTFIKIIIVLFGKKNRRDSLLSGVEEIDRKFKHVKININENILKRRICYRNPKHEPIDQLEIVFEFGLETNNEHEFAEAYAAGLYDVKRLRDRWDRDLTVQELVIEQ